MGRTTLRKERRFPSDLPDQSWSSNALQLRSSQIASPDAFRRVVEPVGLPHGSTPARQVRKKPAANFAHRVHPTLFVAAVKQRAIHSELAVAIKPPCDGSIRERRVMRLDRRRAIYISKTRTLTGQGNRLASGLPHCSPVGLLGHAIRPASTAPAAPPQVLLRPGTAQRTQSLSLRVALR